MVDGARDFENIEHGAEELADIVWGKAARAVFARLIVCEAFQEKGSLRSEEPGKGPHVFGAARGRNDVETAAVKHKVECPAELARKYIIDHKVDKT